MLLEILINIYNMKHLRKFNENNIDSKTFSFKYKDLIDSKDIVITDSRDYISIKCKEGITIPELEELSIKKEDDTYYITKMLKFDFGDVYTFDMDSLGDILKKSPVEIKSELQSIYNKTFENPYHLNKIKLRELFFDFYK